MYKVPALCQCATILGFTPGSYGSLVVYELLSALAKTKLGGRTVLSTSNWQHKLCATQNECHLDLHVS